MVELHYTLFGKIQSHSKEKNIKDPLFFLPQFSHPEKTTRDSFMYFFLPLSLEYPRRDFPQRNYNLKENKHFSVWTCTKSNCSWAGKPVSTFGSPICSMTDYSQHVYQKMLLAKIKLHLHILLACFKCCLSTIYLFLNFRFICSEFTETYIARSHNVSKNYITYLLICHWLVDILWWKMEVPMYN